MGDATLWWLALSAVLGVLPSLLMLSLAGVEVAVAYLLTGTVMSGLVVLTFRALL